MIDRLHRESENLSEDVNINNGNVSYSGCKTTYDDREKNAGRV